MGLPTIPANFFRVKGVTFLTAEYQDFLGRRHEYIRSFPKTSEDILNNSEALK